MSFDGIPTNLYDSNTLDGIGVSGDFGDTIAEAISTNNIFIEATYLRLDTSNDPLTGTLAMNGDISVSGTTTTQIISANTYYGISPFTGALNGHLSVSGNSFFQGTVSINGDTYFKGYNYFTNVSTFDTGDLTLSGKQTRFNVSNLPYRSGDVVSGKQYSGQDLMMIDNSTFFAGTVIRISVSELLKNFTGAISVNNNITVSGTISTGGALTLGALPIGGIADLNYYDMGPNVGTNEWDSGSFTAMPSGDYVIWWSFSHKSTSTTSSGAGHLLEYYDNTGTWIQAIADDTNISTANVEFSNSRNRVLNIGSTFTKIRVRVGTLATSGTQTLITTDVIMARKFF